MFQLENVCKYFTDGHNKRWVFENFTYSFEANTKIGISGPSGSGKSTLLMLLAGLLSPNSGTISFQSENLKLELSSASRKELTYLRRYQIGFVFQFFNLLPSLTALENVLLPLELTSQRPLREAARSRMIEIGLENHLDAFPNELSGGEQQRVAIARAFAHNPSVVLADEPTGNLDKRTAKEAIDFLWREASRTQTLLVVASHDDAVIQRCDSVLTLE